MFDHKLWVNLHLTNQSYSRSLRCPLQQAVGMIGAVPDPGAGLIWIHHSTWTTYLYRFEARRSSLQQLFNMFFFFHSQHYQNINLKVSSYLACPQYIRIYQCKRTVSTLYSTTIKSFECFEAGYCTYRISHLVIVLSFCCIWIILSMWLLTFCINSFMKMVNIHS